MDLSKYKNICDYTSFELSINNAYYWLRPQPIQPLSSPIFFKNGSLEDCAECLDTGAVQSFVVFKLKDDANYAANYALDGGDYEAWERILVFWFRKDVESFIGELEAKELLSKL